MRIATLHFGCECDSLENMEALLGNVPGAAELELGDKNGDGDVYYYILEFKNIELAQAIHNYYTQVIAEQNAALKHAETIEDEDDRDEYLYANVVAPGLYSELTFAEIAEGDLNKDDIASYL